ncbi:DUF6973 domain-containing protein [Flavobacterium pedocola]
MKQKTRSILKFFLIATFVSLISCNDEIINSHNDHTENKNKISLFQFKKETGIKNFKTIVKSSLSDLKSTNKDVEISDFFIDTLAIQRHISQTNETTYSFRIYPFSESTQPNQIYNLVYRKENNIWEKSIFLLNQNSNYEFDTINLIFDSKHSYLDTTNRQSTVCTSTTPVTYCSGTSACTDRCDASSSSGCPTGECYRYIETTVVDCSTGGGGVSDPGDPNNPGGSGYIPTNPFEFTPNMFDNPVYDDPNYINAIKAQHFFSNLSYAQQVWANENRDSYNKIINYLISQNWTDESIEFTNQLIDTICQNGIIIPEFSVDDYPGKNGGRPFEWWKDNQYMISNFQIFNQTPNPAELIVFSLMPDKALFHIENSTTALNKTVQLVQNNTLTGIEDGRADAFRHAYWNALGTAEIGSVVTEIFTHAHEAFSSGLPKQMDLFNNKKGRDKAIRMSFNFLTNDDIIADSILIEVNIGNLVYINNGVLTPTD